MVKKLLLPSLLFALHFTGIAAIYKAEPSSQINQCTAPPPDSFRVTSIGYNFVSVAWNTAWPGANHLLSVFEENTSGGWDSISSVTLINTSTYSVGSLMPSKKYKFGIRTICDDDIPGDSMSAIIPPIGLIVELILNGKMPINPVPTSCTNINYLDPNNKWVGFKLSKYIEGKLATSNFFEFEKTQGDVIAKIKRVEVANILVAANFDNIWPTPIIQVAQAGLLFRVGEINSWGTLDIFGYVEMALNEWPIKSVDICPSPSYPWDDAYTFEPLVARSSKVQQGFCSENPGNQVLFQNRTKKVSIEIQNPFSENLNIFFPESSLVGNYFNISLLDLNGKIHFKEQIDVLEPQISIPLGLIPAGFYFLNIESNGEIQNLRVIKSE